MSLDNALSALPKVLLSGDKNKIDLWREQKSIDRTKKNRPDLYKN